MLNNLPYTEYWDCFYISIIIGIATIKNSVHSCDFVFVMNCTLRILGSKMYLHCSILLSKTMGNG